MGDDMKVLESVAEKPMRRVVATVKSLNPLPAGASLVTLELATGHSLRFLPGTLVFVDVDALRAGPFAIASAPGALPSFELVIGRDSSQLAQRLAAGGQGARWALEVDTSCAFPMHSMVGRRIALLAAGTGVAPMRSAVQFFLSQRERYRQIALFYGCRRAEDFLFTESFDGWRRHGVEVFPTVSGPPPTGWCGHEGYVQRHVGGWLAGGEQETLAVLAGPPQMVVDNALYLRALGLAPGAIFSNQPY